MKNPFATPRHFTPLRTAEDIRHAEERLIGDVADHKIDLETALSMARTLEGAKHLLALERKLDKLRVRAAKAGVQLPYDSQQPRQIRTIDAEVLTPTTDPKEE
jgi:hypothetical protein